MKPPANPLLSSIPSREATSVQQISTLLSVIATLEPFLSTTQGEDPLRLPPQLDGAALASAVTTFSKACDRLDDILEDRTRWTLTQSDEILKAVRELTTKQAQFLDEQTASARSIRRPSFQLRPTLIQVQGEFVAYHGDPTVPGMSIAGKGPTPEAALRDFDKAFFRVPDEQLQLILDPDTAPKKPRRRKSK